MLFDNTGGMTANDPYNVAMRAAINNSTAKFKQYVVVTLKDGITIYNWDDTELYQGGITLENAICGANQFPIGTMVTGKCVIKVFDTARQYPAVDFYDARIEPFIEVEFEYGGSTVSSMFDKGKFTCNSQKWNNGVFTIEGLDDIELLNQAFDSSWFGTTETGTNIIRTTCSQCGITLSSHFTNMGVSETLTIPSDTMTCREVVQDLIKTGEYIFMNNVGEIDWGYVGYTPTVVGGHTDLVTSQYNFQFSDYIEPRVWNYLNPDGTVRVSDTSSSASSNPYALSATCGPFISQLSDADLLTYAGGIMAFQITSLSYYLADVSAVGNPLVEAGDGIYITDVLTNTSKLIIASNVQYTFGRATQIHSYGRPIRENNNSGYTQSEYYAQQNANVLSQAQSYTDSQLASWYPARVESPNGDYSLRMQNDGNLVIYYNGSADWYIGSQRHSVPMLKSTTASGTTNTNGQVNLGLTLATTCIVDIYTTTNTTTKVIPYAGSATTWWASCRKVSDDSKVASTALTFNIRYYDLS